MTPDGRKNLSPEEQEKRRSRLLLAAAAKLKKQILAARKSPAAFIEFVWRTPKGERVKLEPFHHEWLQLFQSSRRVQIEAAKSHAKTTCAIGFVIWMMGTNPNIRIKLFTQSDEKARERLTLVSDMILSNKLVKLTFPNLRPAPKGRWDKSALIIERDVASKDPSLEASGVMGSVEGGRADLVLLDDISDFRTALIYPQHRETIKKKVYAEIMPLLDPEGTAISIGTPHHACFHPSSPVLTRNGSVPAGRLQYTDEVWIRAGHYGPPQRITRHPSCKSMFELRLIGHGDPLLLTGTHRVPTQRGLLRVSQVRVGDMLPIEGYSGERTIAKEAFPREQPVRHDLPRHPRIKSRLSREQLARDLAAGMTYGQIAKKHDYSTGKKYVLYLISCYGLPRRRSRQVMDETAPLDPQFWRLIGYWLAEGDLHTSAWNNAVRLSFGRWDDKAERQLAADAKRIVETVLEVPCHIRKTAAENTSVTFRCKALVAWLETHFGRGAHGKRLPAFFERLPEPHLREALLGWMLGDGNVHKEYTRITTVSTDLAHGWQRVLVGLGIPSRVTWSKPTSTDIVQRDGNVCKVHGRHPVYNLHLLPEHAQQLGLPNSERVIKSPRPQRMKLVRAKHGWRLWLPVRKKHLTRYHGPVIAIATTTGYMTSGSVRVHNSDVIASLRVNPEWKSYVFAVGSDTDPYLPLWPSRWGREALKRLRNEVGPLEYDRAYRCKAVSSSLSIVKPEHIQYYDADLLGDPRTLYCVQAYDLAITDKRQSSYFAGVTVLYDRERNYIFVVDAWRARLGFTEQAHAIIAEARKWRPDMITIEETGYQQALREYLLVEADMLLPIYPVRPGNKSKELRLMETLPAFESGRIYFHPDLDPLSNPEVATRGDIVSQLIAFNQSPDKDIGDAFAYAVRALRNLRDIDEDDEWNDGEGLATRMSIL